MIYQLLLKLSGMPTNMGNVRPCCGRCGNSMCDNGVPLALEKESTESLPRELRLCPRCVESFELWYWKRGKCSSKVALGLRSKGASTLSTVVGSNGSKRRHRRKKEIQRVLVVASLSILVFLLVFYWTWTILRTTARID